MMINQFKDKLIELKGKKSFIKSKISQKNKQLVEKKKDYEIIKQSFEIIQKTAFETQNSIKIFITDIVNTALETIPFKVKPDSFNMEFVYRRNQIECDFFYLEKGQKINPLRCGGGLLDIVSFALRIACLSLRKNKNNVLFLDEIFKNINDPDENLELKFYVGEIIKKLSEKLKLQFILVGSNNDFVDIADKIIEIRINKDGYSCVK